MTNESQSLLNSNHKGLNYSTVDKFQFRWIYNGYSSFYKKEGFIDQGHHLILSGMASGCFNYEDKVIAIGKILHMEQYKKINWGFHFMTMKQPRVKR